jgi:hypothetical protein
MKMILLYKFKDQEKAQLLNDYFGSIATLDNDNKDIPYMTDRGPGILTEIIVTELDINDIISCRQYIFMFLLLRSESDSLIFFEVRHFALFF